MPNNSNKSIGLKSYILCFSVPILFLALAYISLGIYPGSDNLIITYDLRAQLLPLYGYLSNPGPGYDNLFYSMSGGLGGNFFGAVAYYYSVFDLVYLFVPIKYLPDAIYCMILFKIGLCGVSMCAFLRNSGRVKLSTKWAVALSCCYALMSYNVMHFIMPMWYDAVLLLPYLALSIEKIVSGKKNFIFILLFSFGIIDNYYLSYMNAIAVFIYFIFRIIEEKIDGISLLKRFIQLLLHVFISAGMSLFVILPVFLNLRSGKLAEGNVTDTVLFKNSLLDILYSFKSQQYQGLDFNASPNIFCGSVVVFLTIFFIVYGKNNLRSRVAVSVIIVFYFISFMIGPVDRLWHGFREPMGFSCRYAYTFSFFMTVFAVRGIQTIGQKKIKSTFAALRWGPILVIAFTLIELFNNAAYILARIGTDSGYTTRNEYYRYIEYADDMIPYDELLSADTYGRLVNLYKFSSYDGAMFGYDGLAEFNSNYNYGVSEFFRKMGTATIYQSIGDTGMTPPLACLIGARYILSYSLDLSDYYDPIKTDQRYCLYENRNALPLVFEAKGLSDNLTSDLLRDDPYENINIVCRDLFGTDICVPFEKISYDQYVDQEIINQDLSSNCYGFSVPKAGHYFFFVEYMADEISEDETEYDGYNHNPLIVRDSYFDDELIGEYGNNRFNFCRDLGFLNENSVHKLMLESSADNTGAPVIYYLNNDYLHEVIKSVNGFRLTNIDRKGILFKGFLTEASTLLVSLPYEDGYRIYVDGIRTEYDSYRNCFLTVNTPAGEHEIFISYYPRGLVPGIVLSFFFFVVGIIWSFADHKRGYES